MQPLPEHFGRDEGDAFVGDVKTPAVFFRIYTHLEAGWDARAAIDDHALEHCAAPDFDVGQNHRLVDRAITVNAHAREKQRALYGRAADDAAAGHHRIDRRAAPPVGVEN